MMTSLRFDAGASPWLFDGLTHLWQSTVVALVILVVMRLAPALSARTRRTLGWIAVAKFFLPVSWLIERLTAATAVPDAWFNGGQLVLPMKVAALEGARAATQGGGALSSVVILLWATGAIGVLVTWVAGAARSRRRIFADAEPASDELRERLDRAAERVALRRPPELRVSASGFGPAIVGVRRPVLVLPRGLAEAMNTVELDAILIHECVHVLRRDTLGGMVRAGFVALFWFNPVAWLLSRAISFQTEKACDERVVELTGDADTYARSIVSAVRFGLGLTAAGASGATTPPVLERVKAILSLPMRRERPVLRRAVVVGCLVAIGLSGWAGSIAAEATPPPGSGAPAPRYKIGTIKFVTPSEMTEQAVREALELTEGGAFDEVTLDRAIRSLYRTGKFRTIEIRHQVMDASTFNLVVELTPKPAEADGDAAARPPEGTVTPPSAATVGEFELSEARRKLNDARERLQKLREERSQREQDRQRLNQPNRPQSDAITPADGAGGEPMIYPLELLDRRPAARFQGRPKYPFEMRRARIEGEVIVEFVIDAAGEVVSADAVRSSRPEFEAAAVETVRKWRFNPGMKNGQRVATRMQVPIVFRVQE